MPPTRSRVPSIACQPFTLLTLVALAALLVPVRLPAQVTLLGSQTSVRYDAVPVGATSAAQSIQFRVMAGTSLGTAEFLTAGFPGKDFVDAGGSTCGTGTYSADTTCVVNVAFHPAAPGWRSGGLVFPYANGGVAASIYLYGYGAGAQAAFLPPVITTFSSNSLSNWNPVALATDPQGNVYVLDSFSGDLTEFATDGTQSVAFAGVPYFASMAIDGVGNLYEMFYNWGISPPFGGAVFEYSLLTGQGGNQVGNSVNPVNVAVDGAGNIYISDSGYVIGPNQPEGPAQLVKIAPDGAETVLSGSIPGGWLYPAVDGFGNIYTLDGNGQGYKSSLNAAGVYTQTAVYPATGLTNPSYPAVDGGGNLYFVADCNGCGDPNGRLIELTPTGQQFTLYSGTSGGFTLNSNGYPIALDDYGNIYLLGASGTQGGNVLVKFARGAPVKLAFPTPTAGGSTDTADGVQSATLQNIGNEPLDIYALDYPKDFPGASGAVNACAPGAALKGNTCRIAASFAPVTISGTSTTIPLQEYINLATNARNGLPDPAEALSVSGTETKRAPRILVTSSARFPPVGTYVAFDAAVQGAGPTPSGTVLLNLGTNWLTLPLTGGEAAFQTAKLPVGITPISAAYPGDAVYAAGTALPFGQIVTKAATTVNLVSLKSTAAKGAPVTFRANVSTSGFNPAPTGTVTFFSGTSRIAIATLSGGEASVTINSLPTGADSIKAVYSGDGLYFGEASAVVTETITP